MSIESQVSDTFKKLSENRFEDAIVAVSVALSATARLEYPNARDKKAHHNFLNHNLPIISKIGWIAFGVSQNINFKYRRLDKFNKGSEISTRTMPEMLYDVIRCTAAHEAKLPDNLQFTNDSVIQLGNDGELVLPIAFIYGLLMAVVASPKNTGRKIEKNMNFKFNNKSVLVNELWGEHEKLKAFIGVK